MRRLARHVNWRGAVSIAAFILLWTALSHLKAPGFAQIPDPAAVGRAFWDKYLPSAAYWHSWAVSFERVGYGFLLAQLLGIPLGIAVAWNVVIAAEMIASNAGLGRLTWEGYVSQTGTTVIVGMISIGLAGYLSTLIVTYAEKRMMPWQR